MIYRFFRSRSRSLSDQFEPPEREVFDRFISVCNYFEKVFFCVWVVKLFFLVSIIFGTIWMFQKLQKSLTQVTGLFLSSLYLIWFITLWIMTYNTKSETNKQQRIVQFIELNHEPHWQNPQHHTPPLPPLQVVYWAFCYYIVDPVWVMFYSSAKLLLHQMRLPLDTRSQTQQLPGVSADFPQLHSDNLQDCRWSLHLIYKVKSGAWR